MRVLFVVNDPRFFVTHRLQLAVGIRAAGHDVSIAVPTTGYDDAIKTINREEFSLHAVEIERQGLNPIRDLTALLRLITLYRRLKPNIVHHVTIKPILYGTFAARLARIESVVNAVSGMGRLFGASTQLEKARRAVVAGVYRAVLRHPNMRVIFQNTADRDEFVRARIVSTGATVIIPGSGAQLRAFDPRCVPDKPPLVLMPSRLLRQKGVREFVAAATVLAKKFSQVRFAIIGDAAGNRDALSDNEIEAIRRGGIVELWGWTDDVPSAMRQAAIVCLPTYHEGLPKGLIDACAAGRAIVATDIPGCRAIVTHGDNGLLVPPRNVAALAEALETLLSNAELRTRMGRRAREIAEQRFDVNMVVKATLGVYADLSNEAS